MHAMINVEPLTEQDECPSSDDEEDVVPLAALKLILLKLCHGISYMNTCPSKQRGLRHL